MNQFWLSKSTFVRSIQCQKSLYLNKYHKELRDEISDAQQATFSQGTNVGELAQQLFPGGEDVTPENYYDFSKSIERTKELIQSDNVVIYEAAFEFDGILCALDILVKENGIIKAYEVKSSTEVKQVYVYDAGLQYYVMKASGYEPSEISIVHINNKYERNGNLELDKLFNVVSIKKEIEAFQNEIPRLIVGAEQTLKGVTIPEQGIGPHCSDPYTCDFKGHCWKHIPEYSVFNISRLVSAKKFELYEQGILDIKEVPDYYLNQNQLVQVEAERTGETIVDKRGIYEFIQRLNYPLFYLDFETFQSAIPLFDKSKPYEQTVFQYSLHIQKNQKTELEHYEHLAQGDGSDPRLKFVEQLISDCGKEGDVLVYNISFERSRLKELAEIFPEYEEPLYSIIDRMVDLMAPFQQKMYYAPDLKGSYSIKYVLPSLVPELSYKDLEIQNGGMAMDTFKAMMIGAFEGDEEQTRKALLEYCKLDTYAMVKILEKLNSLTTS